MSPQQVGEGRLKFDLPFVLLGAGGHGKVIAALLAAAGRRIIGVCDPVLARAKICEWRGIPVLGDDSCLSKYSPEKHEVALGVGILPRSSARLEMYQKITRKGYSIPALVHPLAIVDESAIIESGAQIMAGSVVQPDCHIGKNAIVNTSASIDHDCVVGDHTHIAPGVVICGGVLIGSSTFIGASATIFPQIRIGSNCLIAAGSRVSKDLKNGESNWQNHKKLI
jgi:UDP-perosamine 4-acetyltransferase